MVESIHCKLTNAKDPTHRHRVAKIIDLNFVTLENSMFLLQEMFDVRFCDERKKKVLMFTFCRIIIL